MSIALTCDCTKAYSVPDHFAGRKFRCKRCDEIIRVPARRKARKAEEETPKPKRRRRPRRSQRARAGVDWHDEEDSPTTVRRRRRRRTPAVLEDDDSSVDELGILDSEREVIEPKPKSRKKPRRRPEVVIDSDSEPEVEIAAADSDDSEESRPIKRTRRGRRTDTVRSKGRLGLLNDSDLEELPKRGRKAKKRRVEEPEDELSDEASSVDSESGEAPRARRRRGRKNVRTPERSRKPRRRARDDESDLEYSDPHHDRPVGKKNRKKSRPDKTKTSHRDEEDVRRGKKKDRKKELGKKLGKKKPVVAPRGKDARARGGRPEQSEGDADQKKQLIVIGACVGALLLVGLIIGALMMSGGGDPDATTAAENALTEKFELAEGHLGNGVIVEAHKAYIAAIEAAKLAERDAPLSDELADVLRDAEDNLDKCADFAAIIEAGGASGSPDDPERRNRLAAIMAAAREDHPGFQLAAVKLLAHAAEPETAPVLAELAKSKNNKISSRARETLIKMSVPEALPFIEEYLDADGSAGQELALNALVVMDHEDAAPLLGRALVKFGDRPEIAQRLLEQLRLLGDPRALDDVKKYAETAEGELVELAQEVIDRSQAD